LGEEVRVDRAISSISAARKSVINSIARPGPGDDRESHASDD
jgi:hypothetical protein